MSAEKIFDAQTEMITKTKKIDAVGFFSSLTTCNAADNNYVHLIVAYEELDGATSGIPKPTPVSAPVSAPVEPSPPVWPKNKQKFSLFKKKEPGLLIRTSFHTCMNKQMRHGFIQDDTLA